MNFLSSLLLGSSQSSNGPLGITIKGDTMTLSVGTSTENDCPVPRSFMLRSFVVMAVVGTLGLYSDSVMIFNIFPLNGLSFNCLN